MVRAVSRSCFPFGYPTIGTHRYSIWPDFALHFWHIEQIYPTRLNRLGSIWSDFALAGKSDSKKASPLRGPAIAALGAATIATLGAKDRLANQADQVDRALRELNPVTVAQAFLTAARR